MAKSLPHLREVELRDHDDEHQQSEDKECVLIFFLHDPKMDYGL